MNRRRYPVLLAALVLAGCSSLPTNGPVHTRSDDSAGANQAPYFSPPGPAPGADPRAVVEGFLLAVQANPPSAAVARSFLTERSKDTWKPVQGTIVYDAASVEHVGNGVVAHLTGVHRLDRSGAWHEGTTASSLAMSFKVVFQNGEWRIADPPESLPVPASYFRNLYVPYMLFFYDRSGTVMVPRRIYLPRGEQIATNLVRGLLAGPGPELAGWTESAIPPGVGLDQAVRISENGLAEVPLGREVQRMTPPELGRLVVQLAWTLRQVPGISRLRVSSNGVVVPLPNGVTDLNLSSAPEHDPFAAASSSMVAISAGQVVTVDADGAVPVGGPLGQPGFKLRSVAQRAATGQVAAVSADGSRLYLAANHGGRGAGSVRSAITGAANLLRPVYDRFGELWVVDAARTGAVVHVVSDGTDRVVAVPGVSGRRITAFNLTRDGARLLIGLPTAAPAIGVSNLVRSRYGRLVRALGMLRIAVEGTGVGVVADVAQDGPTTASVLTRSSTGTARIVTVELDGSPGVSAPVLDPAPDPLVSLLASADPNLPLRATDSEHRLLEWNESGQWSRIESGIFAAAYLG